MTNVRDTSIEAYHEHVDTGHFSRQQRQLLAAIHDQQDYSRLELSDATGIRLSSVCGAVHELVGRGVLVEGAKRPCKISGRTINPVGRRGGA